MFTDSIKPNFLCIGTQKAGTSWLHHNLKQHPEVWLPPHKEIHYFDQIHYLDKSPIVEENRLKTLRKMLNIDKSTLNSIVNSNSKVDISEKVEQQLLQNYKKQEDWIRERFKLSSFER